MKNTTTTPWTDEVLVYDLITVPTTVIQALPDSAREFLTEQVRPLCREQCDGDVAAYAAQHPLFGCVAGFISATLRRTGDQAHLADLTIGCCDEFATVRAINGQFENWSKLAVTYRPGRGSSLDFVTARVLALGIPLDFHRVLMLPRHINLAESVAMGCDGRPPLGVALEALGLGVARKQLCASTAFRAYHEGDRVTLADELLARVQDIGRIYSALYWSRDVEVLPMLVDGELLMGIAEADTDENDES